MAAGSSAQLELELLVRMLSVLCPSWVCGGLWVVLVPPCRNETRKYHGGGGRTRARLPMTTTFNWTNSSNECGIGDIQSFLQLCSISLVMGPHRRKWPGIHWVGTCQKKAWDQVSRSWESWVWTENPVLTVFSNMIWVPARALKSQGLHLLYAKWR